MNRPDLNTLSKEVFEANKAKGFHDVEVSNETLLMLVITELSEAVEADRKEKRFSLEKYEYHTMTECQGWLTPDEQYRNVFERIIKDTIEDELADAVIRLLDLAGLRDYTISEYINGTEENVFGDNFEKTSFSDKVFVIVSNITDSVQNINFSIGSLIESIDILCSHLNIDLWQHVSLKLKYNQTRPIKHGKNY